MRLTAVSQSTTAAGVAPAVRHGVPGLGQTSRARRRRQRAGGRSVQFVAGSTGLRRPYPLADGGQRFYPAPPDRAEPEARRRTSGTVPARGMVA